MLQDFAVIHTAHQHTVMLLFVKHRKAVPTSADSVDRAGFHPVTVVADNFAFQAAEAIFCSARRCRIIDWFDLKIGTVTNLCHQT